MSDPTISLSLWQGLNREFEQTAKALCWLTVEYEEFKTATRNRIANLETEMKQYKERCQAMDMEAL